MATRTSSRTRRAVSARLQPYPALSDHDAASDVDLLDASHDDAGRHGKRVTVRKSAHQLVRLHQVLQQTGGHPSQELRASLAEELKLSPKIVNTWFRDERSKYKKGLPPSGGGAAAAIVSSIGPIRSRPLRLSTTREPSPVSTIDAHYLPDIEPDRYPGESPVSQAPTKSRTMAPAEVPFAHSLFPLPGPSPRYFAPILVDEPRSAYGSSVAALSGNPPVVHTSPPAIVLSHLDADRRMSPTQVTIPEDDDDWSSSSSENDGEHVFDAPSESSSPALLYRPTLSPYHSEISLPTNRGKIFTFNVGPFATPEMPSTGWSNGYRWEMLGHTSDIRSTLSKARWSEESEDIPKRTSYLREGALGLNLSKSQEPLSTL